MQHRLANLVHDYNNQATLPLSYATGSHTIAVISTDVENFHYINDKYGYPLGNEILNIVCEGVETQEIADFLQNEGCNEIQGFLYYRPMCQEDFEKLILK